MLSYLNTPGNRNLSKQFQGNSLTDVIPRCDNTTFGCCNTCDNLSKLSQKGNNCEPKVEQQIIVVGINMF
jgi:hypothetical protein